MNLSKYTMGCTSMLKVLFVDYDCRMDTQFRASEKAVELCNKQGDQDLLIIKLDGIMTVVTIFEAEKKDDIDCYLISGNGGWTDDKDDPRVEAFGKEWDESWS